MIDKDYYVKYNREYRIKNPDYEYNVRLRIKTEVLTHYGKNGVLQCCWPECNVVDVDMLSLDHTKDNGAEHRRELTKFSKHRCGGGTVLYRKLKRQNYPDGYQTLCHNHQWKKEILRRRRIAGSMEEAHDVISDSGSTPLTSTNIIDQRT